MYCWEQLLIDIRRAILSGANISDPINDFSKIDCLVEKTIIVKQKGFC